MFLSLESHMGCLSEESSLLSVSASFFDRDGAIVTFRRFGRCRRAQWMVGQEVVPDRDRCRVVGHAVRLLGAGPQWGKPDLAAKRKTWTALRT